MTAQFHAGDEVEVQGSGVDLGQGAATDKQWRKAKIAHYFDNLSKNAPETYGVRFPDNSRAVFDAAHIRPVSP